MKKISLLLILLSIINCKDAEDKTEVVENIETAIYDNLSIEEKNNALIKASKDRNLETVKALIESGADVNADYKFSDLGGGTVLMYASSTGQIEVVKYLIEAGADIEDDYGRTALDLARRNGHTEIVEYLESKNAS